MGDKLGINEIHAFADYSRSYEPLVAHPTSGGTQNKTLNVCCPDRSFGIRSGSTRLRGCHVSLCNIGFVFRVRDPIHPSFVGLN